MTRAARHKAWVALGAALVCALGAAPTAQARDVAADGILSPRLAALARPAVGGRSAASQAAAVGLPKTGPGSLQRRGRRLLVEVRFAGGVLGHLDELRAAGAELIGASRRYQTATVAVKPGGLAALDGVAGAQAARESLAPAVSAVCPSGEAVSQGDSQLATDQARADFGLDGSGVTVGVISDSFATAAGTATSAAQDVADGDLPGSGNPCGYTTPVGVLSDYAPLLPSDPESTDEGRGMAQIVHDLAPGATIDFATAEGGELGFAESIRQLAAAGAEVIVDDISYFGEPFFQDGPVAVAATEVEERGVTYLTAAGNDNLEAQGNDISSWETPKFRDAAECPSELKLGPTEARCLDFDPKTGTGHDDDTFGITVEPESTLIVDLQWAEPWFGVHSDVDAHLLDKAGKPVSEVEGGTSDNITEQVPVEELAWENKGASAAEVQLAIDRCFGLCNPTASTTTEGPIKVLLAENGSGVSATEYPKSAEGDVVGPAVYGHAGSPNVIAVGAVPFTNSGIVEPYSSHGPVTHLFGPVTGPTPAAKTAAQVIQKPDIVATDCVSTSFFVPLEGIPGFHFCGTSAAAPHAAAVAALAKQANPGATPGRIRNGLESTARPVGAHANDNIVGAGLVNGYGAVDEIALPPKVSFPGAPQLTNSKRPAIPFAANRPATFSCTLDGGPEVSCSSPFAPESPLSEGRHVFAVEALDLSGRTGRGELSFVVDTVPPKTFFIAHPRKNVRTRRGRVKLRFRFGSNSPGSRFVCRVDQGLFRYCPEVLVRRFAPGVHTVRVKAIDPAGNVDPSDAAYRFRVRRVGSRR